MDQSVKTPRGRHGVVGPAHAGLGQRDIVHAGFPDQHVKAQLEVQILHDPRLGGKAGARAMARLAQLHQAGRADRVTQRFQVGKVLVSGIYGAHRPGMRFEPRLQGIARLRGGAACKRGGSCADHKCPS
jgi:hypothetical protein